MFGTTVSGRPPEPPGVSRHRDRPVHHHLPTWSPSRPRHPARLAARPPARPERGSALRPPAASPGSGPAPNCPERVALVRQHRRLRELPGGRRPSPPLHGLRLSGLEGVETTNYPLSLTAYPGTGLALRLGYDPELVRRRHRRADGRVPHRPARRDARRRRPPARPAAAARPYRREQVLRAWNDTATDPPDTTVADLFAAQVRRAPRRRGLQAGDDRLTYRELDARAERLAARPAGLGVRPERPPSGCSWSVPRS
ncbi:hypothetical protein LT493_15405 [Streptomyces tricolor]|nr:hypothetical protein [Streptomyces tricolor]